MPRRRQNKNKRKLADIYEPDKGKKKKRRSDDAGGLTRIPKLMIGFGVPRETLTEVIGRPPLPTAAEGPPFFYYENVAITLRGIWNTISRFLYDISPEFVDSKYFCAATRKRGYVHNLPLQKRCPLLPLSPRTIFEAFPATRKWWPSWDPRTQLNCIRTSMKSTKSIERICKVLKQYNGDLPPHVQKSIFKECREGNLLWVGKNKVARLEPEEMEMLLGFPKNHTSGDGLSKTQRYKSLGNSFQVDTVAYHLSALKEIFPDGINVLSLFSGIGGAEVALHRLGIPLKNVVSVEISDVNNDIMRRWWKQTKQKGNLIHIPDIKDLSGERLEELMKSCGGFDLVIGGSPCNNLSGNNRINRNGLEGKQSILFYDFVRILNLVKCLSPRDGQWKKDKVST